NRGSHPRRPGGGQCRPPADHAGRGDHGRDPPGRRHAAVRPRRAGRAGGARLMRSLGLLARLAGRNLRRRPSQALLLLVTLTLATATLGLALAVYGSADAPWNRVWRATHGFHVQVVAFGQADEPADAAEVAGLGALAPGPASAPGGTGRRGAGA